MCLKVTLKIQLFGKLCVWREWETDPIGLREWHTCKCRQLLAILVSERGEVVAQDKLIEWLWPHSGQERAVSSLRNRVSELRRILEPSLKQGAQSRYIRTLRGGYRFDPPADCDIDSERFERAYREGQALEEGGRWHEAVIQYPSPHCATGSASCDGFWSLA